ncbi:AfsA-related hotdog domain-containing protein [Auritidibacter ignavus]|uniref:AfsA-related hotdog domain-containing protein n=1 Tax=Auritidibacter ignavus TaxID=678932 RepID=UPI00109CC59A
MINDDQLPAPSLPIQRVPDALDVGTLDAHKLDPSRFWLAHQGTLLGQSFQIGFTIPSVGDAVRFAELLEAQRQAGLAYVHQVLHAPKDRVFILDWIVLSSQINEAPGPHAWSVGEITVEPREVAGDGRRTRRAVLAFTIHARGAEIGHGSAKVRLVSQAVYQRLRFGAVRIVTQATEGQQHISGSQETHCVKFSVDPGDPILNDHASDHVTAMSVACALERLVSSLPDSPRLTELALSFASYAECDLSTELRLRGPVGGSFSGELVQDGVTAAEFTGRCDSAPPKATNSTN